MERAPVTGAELHRVLHPVDRLDDVVVGLKRGRHLPTRTEDGTEVATDVLHQCCLGNEEVGLVGKVFRRIGVVTEVFELIGPENFVGDILCAERGFTGREHHNLGVLAGARREHDALVDTLRRVVKIEVSQVHGEVNRFAEVPPRCLVECARDCVNYCVCHYSPP